MRPNIGPAAAGPAGPVATALSRVCIPGPVFSFPGIGNLPKAIPGRPGITGMT